MGLYTPPPSAVSFNLVHPDGAVLVRLQVVKFSSVALTEHHVPFPQTGQGFFLLTGIHSFLVIGNPQESDIIGGKAIMFFHGNSS
jgi:hypothetical protein